MRFLANLLWVIFGGFLNALLWFLGGVLCCITLVGIPLGRQCFKFAKLTLAPFGKEVQYGGGMASVIANVLWILLFGISMAIADLIMGAVLCMTIVGIPLGIQHFKFAKLDLMPFGATVHTMSK